MNHQWRPSYDIRKFADTRLFQGNNKKRNYFEGWYFKMVSADGSDILSVIPGISLSKDGKEQHAFIQLIDGKTAETHYFSFSINDFSVASKGFEIQIGPNSFSLDHLELDLCDDTIRVKGRVTMHNRVDYTTNDWINPGIMGWYRFVPFMECYHGVVSLSHDLQGFLTINDKVFDYDKGKGYIEKDWGSSMPSSWIWMQSNHFNNPTSSFMLSIANIPWLGNSFTGFIGFLHHEGTTHHFATYRHSTLDLEILSHKQVKIRIENRDHTLLVEATSNQAGLLHAPVKGVMDRRIPESINADLRITLLDKQGEVILSDSSSITGLEMVGAIETLLQ